MSLSLNLLGPAQLALYRPVLRQAIRQLLHQSPLSQRLLALPLETF